MRPVPDRAVKPRHRNGPEGRRKATGMFPTEKRAKVLHSHHLLSFLIPLAYEAVTSWPNACTQTGQEPWGGDSVPFSPDPKNGLTPPPPPPAFKSRFAVDSRLRRDATWMRGGQVKVRLMRDDMTAIRWTGDESSNTKVGSDLNDRLLGLGGDDTLTGRLGDDTIYGGSGNDRLRGE